MKLNKKGFTLVELLAVIVVLAIIALIGFTAMGSVIENTRKSAAASTASNFESAAKTYCNVKMMEDSGTAPTTASVSEIEFDNNGSTITGGAITFDKSCKDVTLPSDLKVNDYACSKSGNTWKCGQ